MVYGKKKINWQQNYKLLGFTQPVPVPQGNYYSRRKYSIMMWYEDETGVKRTKKIYFGLKGLMNKVDGEETKTRRVPRSDKFHPFFWEDLLLNSQNTIAKAVTKARKLLLK